MATYAIGDIQGCYKPFRKLLDTLKFDPTKDTLWLVGDLINRGPDSLKTLRYIISLGDSVRTILGNHECHMLAVYFGHKKAHKSDTFSDILEADSADQLINWVRSQPVFYEDLKLGYSMLHAGLPPQWTLEQTRACARELEATLRGDNIDAFLSAMYGNTPNIWSENLTGFDRLRFIINCFTRMRYCNQNGKLNLKEKGPIGSQAKYLMPWFMVPNRKTQDCKLLFGHWSTLGLAQANNSWCLDSGCLWGGELSAMRLDGSEQIISQACESSLEPK
ncbi:MAG: diadenosine tetraphosphatase [Cycloclasticus sp. symbiont of Poecilosclerida sp. M]|nr:MAG: diadenosine tetraphosphatase [Cycloclasticus sp. symbiont of Poecilosclerida sp. M]